MTYRYGSASVVVRRGLTFSSQLLSQSLPNLGYSIFRGCYDNSMLFIEVLRQLVFVLCIVMCDVIRSSPLMFGRIRKSAERGVSRDRLLPRGLERWIFVVRSHFINGHSVIRTEAVGV